MESRGVVAVGRGIILIPEQRRRRLLPSELLLFDQRKQLCHRDQGKSADQATPGFGFADVKLGRKMFCFGATRSTCRVRGEDFVIQI
jgi:hypothetical protein